MSRRSRITVAVRRRDAEFETGVGWRLPALGSTMFPTADSRHPTAILGFPVRVAPAAVPYGVQQPSYTRRSMVGRARNFRRSSGTLLGSRLPALPARRDEAVSQRGPLFQG